MPPHRLIRPPSTFLNSNDVKCCVSYTDILSKQHRSRGKADFCVSQCWPAGEYRLSLRLLDVTPWLVVLLRRSCVTAVRLGYMKSKTGRKDVENPSPFWHEKLSTFVEADDISALCTVPRPCRFALLAVYVVSLSWLAINFDVRKEIPRVAVRLRAKRGRCLQHLAATAIYCSLREFVAFVPLHRRTEVS